MLFAQWAAPWSTGAARFVSGEGGTGVEAEAGQAASRRAGERAAAAAALPSPVAFRESEGRGLLVEVWVNGRGAYTFALDTGAGATILS
ncbi:MAG TPA: hypothetical protein VD968_02845, partial [Pyrinomonadaceae bacterium]|nr:hypothetical protein [Pyrinomonadaceae bacterium]